MISRVTSVGSQPVRTGTAARKASSSFSSAMKSAASSARPTGLDAVFKAAAEKYNVPERLLKAVAKAESGFQPNAVSCCGAEGIMQLMPSTASSLGVENAFDPEQNIIGGAKYISQLLRSFGEDEKLAVAAYNAGSGAVRRYGGVPPYRETQDYVKKVLAYAGEDITPPEMRSGYPAAGSALPSDADTSAGISAAVPALSSSGTLISADSFQLLAKAYVQSLEQEAIDEAAEGRAEKAEKA